MLSVARRDPARPARLRRQRPPARRGARAGFTIIELMVAAATLFVIVAYALATFTYQHQTYVVVDQVSETQQNTRAIASLMERDIRNAGYMVAVEAASCGIDADDSPDVLYLSDADAIRNVDELGAAMMSEKLGADVSAISAGSPDVITVDDVVIDGQATYDTNADGNPDSDFQLGAGAILVDVANPERGSRCGRVTAVSLGASPKVSVDLAQNAFGAAASNPEDLVLVPAHVYAVADGPPPELRRNGELLAKDIEDLQVAWFFDDDGDGQVDGGEYRGVEGNDYDPTALDANALREIRVNLVARTRDDDPRNPDSAGTGQSVENRDTNVAGDDGRRRRVHTATVRVRNIQVF